MKVGNRASSTALLFAGAIAALYLFEPGTNIYHNDQGQLINNAINANQGRTAVMLGLMGNFGVRYGPVPSWFYQCALALTTSLLTVTWIKIVATLATLLAALAIMAEACEISFACCLLCLCGHIAFWSTRDLWDNCFLLPFGAALFAVVVSWLRAPSVAKLAGILVVTWALLHTHLMSGMLVAGAVPLSLWFRREFLFRNKAWATGLLLAFGAGLYPYCGYVLHNWSPPAGAAAQTLSQKLFFVLRIPEVYVIPESLAHPVHDYFPRLGQAFLGLWYVSYAAYGLYYLGMALTAFDALLASCRGWRQEVARIALLVLGFHVLFYISTRAQLYTHYVNAMWCVSAYFVARGANFAARIRLGRMAVAVYAGSSLAALFVFTRYIALRGGMNNDPCLTNQMQAVRGVDTFTRDGPVDIQVPFWREYPLNFSTLRTLDRASGARPQGTGPGCRVVYRDRDQGRSLWYTAKPGP